MATIKTKRTIRLLDWISPDADRELRRSSACRVYISPAPIIDAAPAHVVQYLLAQVVLH